MGTAVAMAPNVAVDDHSFNLFYTQETCIPIEKMASRSGGLFYDNNPLTFQTPTLIFQLSLCASTILLTAFLLKPIGQPLLFSQLLGGVLLGPSLLGFKEEVENILFPKQSYVMLDMVSAFGLMMYFFLVGVKMDPGLIKQPGKKAFVIGISVVLFSLILSRLASVYGVIPMMKPNSTMNSSIPFVATAEAIISFPVIAHYLTELKIANSDYGRLAMSSSMVSGIFTAGLLTYITLFRKGVYDQYKGSVLFVYYAEKLACFVLLIAVILLVFRPALLWMIRRYSTGEIVNQLFILGVLVAVMMSGFVSEHIGHHIIFGPFVLGMAIPAGPPLGSTLVKRLEVIITWIFMPLYLVKNGLAIDIFAISLREFAIIQVIIFSSCFGKFLGAFFPSLYFRVPLKDAITLGLTMNVQGIPEIAIYRLMSKKKHIDEKSFIVMCTSMLIITGVITPLVRAIYDPSKKYTTYKRRTILQLKPNIELRLLACIHNGDHIPAMMNLVEVSNHTQENPIGVYVLHLIELLGRSTTLLISHDERYKTPPSNLGTLSQRVVLPFRNYGTKYKDSLSVQSYTSISPYETMDDDVCTLALKKRVSLIIIPFYEKLAPLRSMNSNVLDKAPCSVAVTVDRGLLRSYKHAKEFSVVVFFLGGADDREALAYGTRMVGNVKVKLTVVRFLPYQKAWESKLDNIVISDFRVKTLGNERVTYREEVAMDGGKTVSVIRSMESDYQLIMVGRRHEEDSPLIEGLLVWKNEETLLGPIGDYLASSDFQGSATVIVVQQQTNVAPGSSDDNLEDLIPLEIRASQDVFKEEVDDALIQKE